MTEPRISATNAKRFFDITCEELNKMADRRGIKNLERYYKPTDDKALPFLKEYKPDSLDKIFVQMAFHAQNATLISNIVKFSDNYAFLKEKLCAFNPKNFLNTYWQSYENKDNPDDKAVEKIVNALRYDTQTKQGLRWNSERTSEKNKDSIMKRYASTLLYCAKFLSKFSNRSEFLNDLKSNYPGKDSEKLIKYFMGNVKKGFSVALTCDFLKEFDIEFCDLPKPDVHIKDTLCTLFGEEENFYRTQAREFDCIKDMQEITMRINDRGGGNNIVRRDISVYQLDRMIWLVCTGNFFLDGSENSKARYLGRIAKETNKDA